MKNFIIGVLLMVSIISIAAAVRSYSLLTEIQTNYRRLQLQSATQAVTTQFINR